MVDVETKVATVVLETGVRADLIPAFRLASTTISRRVWLKNSGTAMTA